MQTKHSPLQKPTNPIKLKILFVFCLIVFLFSVLDARLRPIISTMASSQCRVAATLALNQAIEQELSENPQLYENLYKIQYAPDGTITSISADAAAVNTAKSQLTTAVLKRLEFLEQETLSVPLGTLLGWQLLAGRGPEISMRAVPSGFAGTEFSTKLQSQGINQTMLMGYITFQLEINAILPGFSSTQTITDSVCITQTLVVGQVPQVYAQINA